jgi:hypothetical protein
MRHKLRTLAGLGRHDFVLLCQAWAMLLFIDVGLQLCPLRRVQEFVDVQVRRGKGTPGPRPPETLGRVQRLAGMAARHYLVPLHCLEQALAMQWLLGRRGIATSLRFGVQKTGDGLAAHAWLEFAGRPISGAMPGDDGFSPLEPAHARQR